MLFRPHYEKKIFGIKVPFTPGLIPKEKDRIAKSIGETVGVYLLSPDTIIEALSNKEIDNTIKSWIYNNMERLKENHQSIKVFLENTLDNNYNKFVRRIEEKIRDLIIKQIRKDEFKSLISKSIAEKVNNMKCEDIYRVLDEKLRDFLLELSNSHELKVGIIELIKSKLDALSNDERKLSEILPEEILSSINNYIDENKDEIGNSIKNGFKDPVIQQKLKNSISELVLKNMSKVIMAFVSPDMIAEKIFHMIEKYINSEDTNRDIVMLIKSLLDKLLESKVSEISPKILDGIGEEGFEKISGILIGYIANEDNYNVLLNILGEKLRNSESENKEAIIYYLTKNIDKVLESEELEKSIDLFIANIVEEFLNKSISSMVAKIDEDSILRIYNSLRNIFDKFAINQLPKIIEFFNISKIVEDKIQSFDVNFTEELILDIANKELKAITWLGALLGGIMGILTPLLQMLY
jgi:uncharacterized membrane protein YheB (UPF0754 family)